MNQIKANHLINVQSVQVLHFWNHLVNDKNL